MTSQNHPLETLSDIKKMMERSSRFISLSGWSGVSAGICALVGAWASHEYIEAHTSTSARVPHVSDYLSSSLHNSNGIPFRELLRHPLFAIAAATFAAAFIFAFTFTYIRSRKTGIPIWGVTARRLMISVSVPLIAGAAFLCKLIVVGELNLITPGCLIFYGIALVSAGKYTLSEVRYLGYCEILLGILSLPTVGEGYGLLIWAVGFGILHIIYGIVMWWKYERKPLTATITSSRY